MKKSDIQVLIVDDDIAIGKTLSEAVNRAGFKATVSTRADEALNSARLKHFHAAIVDCMLPVMNGLSFAEALRKSRFGDGVIVLISGIFRDKSFEMDALRKTGAISFMQKPFGPNDLLAVLKPKLDVLIDNQKWSLQTILTKKMESTRERLKVVEHLEEIRGVEFAFVLSILADAKVSGAVNLVSDDGNIFGLKLSRGLLSAVDSDTADEVAVRYLTDTGYLVKEDLQQFKASDVRRTATVAKLIQSANVSPHAASEAQKDQIVFDLKRILAFKKVNINFVPEADVGNPTGLELPELFVELNDTIDSLLTVDYLKSFFEEMMTSLVQRMTSFSPDNQVWKYPIVKRVENIIAMVGTETVLKDLVSKNGNLADVLKAIYCLVIFRQILFTDAQAVKNFEQEAVRRQKILNELESKTPHQIFHYFGATVEAKPEEVQKIFIEFVKSNHPDRLPAEAPSGLRTTTTAVFSKVSEAYEILTNPEKLKEYKNGLSAKEAEKEIKAEGLQRECLDLIRRGSYSKAEEKANEALAIVSSNAAFCLMVWARMKQTAKPVTKVELAEFKKKFEAFSLDERHDPHYHMALGLTRVAMGDVNAIQCFEKAVSLRPQFVEARREINAVQAKGKEGPLSASDILTGDLTSIVSQIFKRKSK